MPINQLLPIINGQLTSDEIFVGAQHWFYPSKISLYVVWKFDGSVGLA